MYSEQLGKNYAHPPRKVTLTTRNEKAEHAWANQKETNGYIVKGGRKMRNARIGENWVTNIPSDMHIYADDPTIQTADAAEICPEIVTFDERCKTDTSE